MLILSRCDDWSSRVAETIFKQNWRPSISESTIYHANAKARVHMPSVSIMIVSWYDAR